MSFWSKAWLFFCSTSCFQFAIAVVHPEKAAPAVIWAMAGAFSVYCFTMSRRDDKADS